jgi:hypothetical protein
MLRLETLIAVGLRLDIRLGGSSIVTKLVVGIPINLTPEHSGLSSATHS